MKCNVCRWWEHNETIQMQAQKALRRKDAKFGACHAEPPRDGGWPIVAADQWCGQFRQRGT